MCPYRHPDGEIPDEEYLPETMEDVYSADDTPDIADLTATTPEDAESGDEERARVYYSPDDEFLYCSDGWKDSSGPTMVELIDSGRLPLQEGEDAFIYTERPPLPRTTGWDRAEGMMLGLAIGDALGNGSEGLTPGARRAVPGTPVLTSWRRCRLSCTS